MKIQAKPLNIPMKVSFKHASAERKMTDGVIAQVTRGVQTGYGEGCPRSYVTGETTQGALKWIEKVASEVSEKCTSVEALKNWMLTHREEINQNPAAWCALETAILDLLAKESNVSVERFLGLEDPKGYFQYTAVISDGSRDVMITTLTKYLKCEFLDYKLKISSDLKKDSDTIEIFKEMIVKPLGDQVRLRIDANNLWKGHGQLEVAIDYIRSLNYAFFAIEEPLSPRDALGLSQFSVELNTPVVLDESCLRVEDFELYQGLPGSFIVNVRVSKMGGVIRSLEVVERARSLGWGVIVGAQVGETSLLSRAALIPARVAGERLMAQEGAYGTLLIEQDPFEPVIMFGAGGRLQISEVNSGFGLCKI